MKRRMRTIGAVLKYLREKAEMPQKEVAKLLNIARPTYAGYETEGHEPSIDILIKLADIYKVSLDFLTGRVFDDWVPHPVPLLEQDCPSMTDMLLHAHTQFEDMGRLSFRVMDKKIHGEYEEENQT